ncbi:hypothetical protein FIBSPDRAFT_903029 [Athelia psychrophila]|uniref:Uncharacterized protein n=1 Tax=Athelia psychrophila TaxID=1759441 RepID=A0A167WI68_9AGAM|nr:hypothetical protein FIBSPDRAFT_903029 [Fibularhizoctonia sp. CBS 109695]
MYEADALCNLPKTQVVTCEQQHRTWATAGLIPPKSHARCWIFAWFLNTSHDSESFQSLMLSPTLTSLFRQDSAYLRAIEQPEQHIWRTYLGAHGDMLDQRFDAQGECFPICVIMHRFISRLYALSHRFYQLKNTRMRNFITTEKLFPQGTSIQLACSLGSASSIIINAPKDRGRENK